MFTSSVLRSKSFFGEIRGDGQQGQLKQSIMGGASRQRLSELDNRFLVGDCIFVLLSRETCS